MMNIAKQILTTRGVNSRVLVAGERQKFKTAGHVGLFDFDGMSKKYVLDECMGLEGVNFLWKSSETGYHLWSLTIRTAYETAVLGLKLSSDCKHVQHGLRQGKWVLRITPKFRENDTRYKPAPKLIHTWSNDSLRPQSIAHFQLFTALTGKTIFHVNSYDWIGLESAEIEDYTTLTDKMKARLSK